MNDKWAGDGLAESERIETLKSHIKTLKAALRNMVDEYVCNVDSYRTGGFYSDPRKDDCVINAEAALEGKSND